MSQLGRSAGLTGFLDLASEAGLDAYAIAAAVGLPREVLTSPDLLVSVESMGRMIEMAAEMAGADDFGLRMAEHRKLSNMGAVGLVIREQPTLRKALQAYTRYQWLQNAAYSLRVQIFGDQALLRIDGPAWQQRQIAEMSVATALRTLRAVMGDSWRPQEVWFTHTAPARLDTHRRIFGVTPLFGQECMGLVMQSAELEAPIPSADPEIARQVAAYLDRLVEGRGVELADKVGELIVALLPEGACSVERVAQHLGMDRRTLHRRLSAEGTTFSRILDATRVDMAASLLTGSDRPLQNVADLLGFSGLSAFAHWFRRKFAQSASAYRAQHAGTVGRPSGILSQAV
jgi:AraC-like DNA-binding protein